MWVYRLVTDKLKRKSWRTWEVGYYTPDYVWVGTIQYVNEPEAMQAVHYLNGGSGASIPRIPLKIEA